MLGVCALVLWSAAVAVGLHTLWSYETTPGPVAAAPPTWPREARITAPRERPVVILALHPQCPCSAATVSELDRLLAHARTTPEVYAVFVAPPDAPDDWVQSRTWRAAAAITGLHVIRDDGSEARRFGARVSGQVLAYDTAGQLQFNGGITGSRGHEGDNAGRAAIEAMLADQPHASSAFVFGCLLFDGDGHAAAWTRTES
jgi:hypothetical protein